MVITRKLEGYLIENIDTKLVRFTYSLKTYCDNNNLNYECMRDVLDGKRKQYRGLIVSNRYSKRTDDHVTRMKQIL